MFIIKTWLLGNGKVLQKCYILVVDMFVCLLLQVRSGYPVVGSNRHRASLEPPRCHLPELSLFRIHLAADPVLAPIADGIPARLRQFESWEEAWQLYSFLLEYCPGKLHCQTCCACGRPGHIAWSLLQCAGCNDEWWVPQELLSWGTWCIHCEGAWQRETIQVALERETGLPNYQGANLFESAEQQAIAHFRYLFTHEAARIRLQLKSAIVRRVCGNGLKIPRQWMVRTHEWERVCRRFSACSIADKRARYRSAPR